MWIIILALVVGLLVGYFNLLPSLLKNGTTYLVSGGLFLLLFIMGVQLGANPEVVDSLAKLGFKAVMLATGAIIGSLIMVIIINSSWEG
jgi:uncharacterized transporter YbjL